MNQKIDIVVYCPDCKSKMSKAGFAWSGKNKRQQYHCSKCGRRTIKMR